MVHVFGTQRCKAGPQFLEGEAVDRGIYFADDALLGRERLVLHDGLHAAFGVAQDPAVAGWIGKLGAQNRGCGFAPAVRIEKRGKSFGAQQRRIARQDNHELRALANGAARDLHRMARPALRLLQDGMSAKRFRDRRDILGLMADDDQNLRRLQRLARAHDVFDERAASRAMQNFREIGTHARPFSGGEDDDGSVGRRHRSGNRNCHSPLASLAIGNWLTFRASNGNQVSKFDRRQEAVGRWAMFCSKCGTNNPDSGQFCVGCGAPLQGEAGLAAGTPPAMAPPIAGLAPPYAGPAETSGKAIASLICGICFLIFPAAVAAIILGHLSLSDINKSAGRLTGRGLATTGLVLGYFGVLGLIPFILIIAAIAIPNLLRARIAANEASAAVSLRTIDAAALMYGERYSNGFPPSLLAMDGVDAGAASCDHAQLIDSVLATGQKNGYVFTYVALPEVEGQQRPVSAPAAANGCTVAGADSFTISADPITRGTTGLRSFFVDQTGVIRWEQNGPANADSPMVGDSQRF